MTHPAPFVWLDRDGLGRHVYAYFRFDFEISSDVNSAMINLFTDSRYQCRVNGTFIGSGPVRFYPEHPEFDTYDIAPYLQPGRNVIAVKALAFGLETFHSILNRGGFIAWGTVQCADGRKIDVSTAKGWMCRKAEGYDQTAPKLSFTSCAIDLFDARKDCADWSGPQCDLSEWRPAIVLDKQESWGTLTPRSIPPLTQQEIVPQKLLGAYELDDKEELLSFRISADDSTAEQYHGQRRVFAYTYIYSPKKQNVRAGFFWGEHFLNNGKQLPQLPAKGDQVNRNDIVLKLKKGWNYFFIKYDLIWGTWEFHMAAPKSAGLRFSPEKKLKSPPAFMTTGPFSSDEEKKVRAIKLPIAAPEELPKLSCGWVKRKCGGTAVNPAVAMAWQMFKSKKEIPADRVSGLFAHDKNGTTFVFDLGHETLGRIFVEFEGPIGAVIDTGFAEEIHRDRPWVLRRPGLWTCDRHISSGGPQRMETFNPRGFRYFQVTVTHNKGPVRILKTGAVAQVYPHTKVGSFECSDAMLNDIWELGWRTLRPCSEDTYVDCPWRERGLYGGDTFSEFALTLATSGDMRLARRCLKLFTQSQNPKTGFLGSMVPYPKEKSGEEGLHDYPVLTLLMWEWYVSRSSDRQFAQELYPVYKRLMEGIVSLRRPDGLLAGMRPFLDWVQIEKNGYNTAMHSVVAAGFAALSRVAGLLGIAADAAKYGEAARDTAACVRDRFWDEKAGAFIDGLREDGARITGYYALSSAWPSVFGVTTAGQDAALRGHFKKVLPGNGRAKHRLETGPYGAFYILGALYKNGDVDIAERFMRETFGVFVAPDIDTAWEGFPGNGAHIDSRCHGWSCAPTYYLSANVLGVPMGFPQAFDAKTIVFSPQVDAITWARGTVPHPAGALRVDWRVQGECLFFNYDAPAGIACRCEPKGILAKKKLIVNGQQP